MEKRTKEYGLDIDSILAHINFPQSTDGLAEGSSNKYFTFQRVNAIIQPLLSALTTDSVSEGNNKYYSDFKVANIIIPIVNALTTDKIIEGNNKYFTYERVNTIIQPLLAALTTSAIAEGSNLYFTQDRVANKADLVNGIIPKSQLPNNYTPQAIRDAVRGSEFGQGELSGTQPSGSISNMRFSDNSYIYWYTFSASDTDGTKYVWCRLFKS